MHNPFLKYEHSVQLTEDYAAPGLKLGFFRLEKKLLLQGSKGLTRDYLPYISGVWEFETMPVHHQQGLIQKHTTRNFAFSDHHPPSNICISKSLAKAIGIIMHENK